MDVHAGNDDAAACTGVGDGVAARTGVGDGARAISIQIGVLMQRYDVDGVQHACGRLVEEYLRLDRPIVEFQVMIEAYRFLAKRCPPHELQIEMLATVIHLLLVRDGAEVIYLEMVAGDNLLRSLVVKMSPPQTFQTRILNVGLTLLEASVVQGRANNVLALLQAKASACVNARTPERPSPLHVAIDSMSLFSKEDAEKRRDGMMKIIRLLCMNGADPNVRHPGTQLSALEALLSTTDFEPVLETTVDALLKAKASPLGVYAHIDTTSPLHCCLKHFSLPRAAVAMTLLRAGANPAVVQVVGCMTPLDMAVANDYGGGVTRSLSIPCGVCGSESTMWCSGKSPYCRLAAACSDHCFEALFLSHAEACPCTADLAKHSTSSAAQDMLQRGGDSIFKRGTFHPSIVRLQMATDHSMQKEVNGVKGLGGTRLQIPATHSARRTGEGGGDGSEGEYSPVDDIRQKIEVLHRVAHKNPTTNVALKKLHMELARENKKQAAVNAKMAAKATELFKEDPNSAVAMQLMETVAETATQVDEVNAYMQKMADDGANDARLVRDRLTKRLKQRQGRTAQAGRTTTAVTKTKKTKRGARDANGTNMS